MPERLDAWITLAADAVSDPAALPPREALLGMLGTTFDATQVSLSPAPIPPTSPSHRLDVPVETGNGRRVVVLTRPAPSFTEHERRRARELRPLLSALLFAAERRQDDAPLSSLRSPLTPRESDVLAHLESGLTATAIGRRLGVSPRTVRKHLENVYRKLDVQDRVSAVLAARRAGLLPGAGARSDAADRVWHVG